MTLMGAAALCSLLNFAIFALMAVWYVAPWLATQQRAEALAPLLWVHAFRHVALQIFSAQQFGSRGFQRSARSDRDRRRHRHGLGSDLPRCAALSRALGTCPNLGTRRGNDIRS